MRIHTNLTIDQVRIAVNQSGGARVDKLVQHRSRTRPRRFDLILTGSSPYRQNRGDKQAASWDEWGIALNALFEADPQMVTSAYPSRSIFDLATGGRFRSLHADDQHRKHRWRNIAPYHSECDCGATQIWDWRVNGQRVAVVPPISPPRVGERREQIAAEREELEWWASQSDRLRDRSKTLLTAGESHE